MSIAVMLTNYLHDLAVALFFVTIIAVLYLNRAATRGLAGGQAGQVPSQSQECRVLLLGVCRRLVRVAVCAFVAILTLGTARTATFRKYEWMEAAGRGQITALVVKHLLLVVLVLMALVAYARIRRGLGFGVKGKNG